MRQNKKGSILLYTLFLSSFLALFFISFQGELESILEGVKGSGQTAREISGIKDVLILLKNNPEDIKSIEANDNLSLVSMSQSGNTFHETLSSNKFKEYWITSSGSSSNMTLKITDGGPLSYSLIAFNSGSEASAVTYSSGLVIDTDTIILSPTLDTHILVMELLGGQVSYELNAKNTTIFPESMQYALKRDINGYSQDEGIYSISYFTPQSRVGINYESLGTYLTK